MSIDYRQILSPQYDIDDEIYSFNDGKSVYRVVHVHSQFACDNVRIDYDMNYDRNLAHIFRMFPTKAGNIEKKER